MLGTIRPFSKRHRDPQVDPGVLVDPIVQGTGIDVGVFLEGLGHKVRQEVGNGEANPMVFFDLLQQVRPHGQELIDIDFSVDGDVRSRGLGFDHLIGNQFTDAGPRNQGFFTDRFKDLDGARRIGQDILEVNAFQIADEA
jgi:hypothetical protein